MIADPSMDSALTELTLRSKSHWGYTDDLMDLWRDQLKISKEFIEKNIVEVAYENDSPIGFYSINRTDSEVDNMWVIPEKIGQGVGRLLFNRMCQKMKEEGIHEITIISDPHADGFYTAMGAIENGKTESGPAGRFLSRFKFSLPEAEQGGGGGGTKLDDPWKLYNKVFGGQ